MARRTISIDIDAAPEVAFAYLEDFRNIASWDPGVSDVQKLTDGPVGVGTRYDVGLLIGGSEQRWTYVCEQHEAPRRVTFATRTKRAVGVDDVTVVPRGEGSTVVWDASFTFRGLLGTLVDPVFGLVFSRIVEKAVGGLRDALRSLPVS